MEVRDATATKRVHFNRLFAEPRHCLSRHRHSWKISLATRVNLLKELKRQPVPAFYGTQGLAYPFTSSLFKINFN